MCAAADAVFSRVQARVYTSRVLRYIFVLHKYAHIRQKYMYQIRPSFTSSSSSLGQSCESTTTTYQRIELSHPAQSTKPPALIGPTFVVVVGDDVVSIECAMPNTCANACAYAKCDGVERFSSRFCAKCRRRKCRPQKRRCCRRRRCRRCHRLQYAHQQGIRVYTLSSSHP